MFPENAPSRFDVALAAMATCLFGGGVVGLSVGLPPSLAAGGGATGAAAVAVCTTASEL